MTRTMRPFTLLVLLASMIAVTLLVTNHYDRQIEILDEDYRQIRLEQIAAESEKSALQQELNRSSSDSYIIQTARDRYGYLMPGEIRFQVTNTDSLNTEHEVIVSAANESGE